MPPHPTPRLRRLALALSAAAALAPAAPAAPAAAEEPTPQAINAHAEFLAYPTTPPPPAPVKVCVVDTGVDLTTDAAPAVVERYSEFGGTVDDTGGGGIAKHGTYVAGVIASQWDGVGSVGIFPRARIVSVRVFPDKDSGTTVATYLAALDRCRAKGAKVVNLSLAGLGTATGPELAELDDTMTNMHVNQDMSIVAAAGNSPSSEIGYPAKFPSVLAVGAADSTGALCPFSSRGPELDISAVGCGVVLTLGGGVGAANGTSYSAPVVSAALAALRAYRPDLSASEAESLLLGSAATTRTGRVLDVTAGFYAAGLGPIVAQRPAVVRAPPSGEASGSPVMHVNEAQASSDHLADLGLRTPRVRRATYRDQILSVLMYGTPSFGRAIFHVGPRRYIRTSGKLRLRLKRFPKRVTAAVDVRGIGRTRAVRVHVRALRGRADH